MPKVRYIGNNVAGDNTGRITLENAEDGAERFIDIDTPELDPPVEITDAEYAQICGSFQIKIVGDTATATQTAVAPSTPTSGQSGSGSSGSSSSTPGQTG